MGHAIAQRPVKGSIAARTVRMRQGLAKRKFVATAAMLVASNRQAGTVIVSPRCRSSAW